MSKVTPIRPPSPAGPEPVAGPAAEPAPDAHGTCAPKYWAFLSYSHHDKLIAKRLQKQLETYRVPTRLVGRETSQGPVPARVAPVFRDRDELHAGADLKASVQDALSKSRWLIVVCTPDAARSPWVNREIIEFKRLHGERRVLALIARGEPFASDMPGREAEECFPPALRRALNEQGLPEGEPLEPIAADMRKHGDGPQRAMLKLLAGMIGVGFDDLVRRDMQRRVRWLSALAGASVLGVVVFAYMAVMAVQARNEAQHQRVQAEGLIEFMLGDLRKKLEPVGRLEVLDSVGEKALAYYGAQESGNLDATALGHRSRAMHLIGEIRDLRGNPAEAQKAFEQAAETTAQLLAQAPNDGQRIFDHAQSVFWVGYAAWRRADGKTAETRFREYLTLAERLVKTSPDNLDWRAEVAFANLNIGMVQLATGRASTALQSLEAAGTTLKEISRQRPEFLLELAKGHGWRADAHELLGDYGRASDQQRERIHVLKSVANAATDRGVRIAIVGAQHSIGNYELAMGHVGLARESISRALRDATDLVAGDSENLRWRGHECSARLSLVDIDLALGLPGAAEQAFASASQCVAQYTAVGSTGVRDSTLIQARYLRIALMLAEPAQRGSLTVQTQAFLDAATARLSDGTAERARLAIELANTALALGAAQTDLVAAQREWRRAEALMQPFAENSDAAVLTTLARARLNMGDVAGAELLAARIDRTSYRHPAYSSLLDQLRASRGTAQRPSSTNGEKS